MTKSHSFCSGYLQGLGRRLGPLWAGGGPGLSGWQGWERCPAAFHSSRRLLLCYSHLGDAPAKASTQWQVSHRYPFVPLDVKQVRKQPWHRNQARIATVPQLSSPACGHSDVRRVGRNSWREAFKNHAGLESEFASTRNVGHVDKAPWGGEGTRECFTWKKFCIKSRAGRRVQSLI